MKSYLFVLYMLSTPLAMASPAENAQTFNQTVEAVVSMEHELESFLFDRMPHLLLSIFALGLVIKASLVYLFPQSSVKQDHGDRPCSAQVSCEPSPVTDNQPLASFNKCVSALALSCKNHAIVAPFDVLRSEINELNRHIANANALQQLPDVNRLINVRIDYYSQIFSTYLKLVGSVEDEQKAALEAKLTNTLDLIVQAFQIINDKIVTAALDDLDVKLEVLGKLNR